MATTQEVTYPIAQAQGRKLLIFTNGSRGDVQPFAALALALQRAGFVICMSTNPNHIQFFGELGLDAVSTCPDIMQLIKAMTTGDASKFFEGFGAIVAEHFPRTLEQKISLVDTFKPDLIVCSPLDFYETFAIAAARSIPFMGANLQFALPSGSMQTVLGEPCCVPHRALGTLLMHMGWSGESAMKNPEILKQLPEAEPFLFVTSQQFMYVMFHPIAPSLYGFSPTLQSTPSDWSADLRSRATVTGFWVMSKDQQEVRWKSGDPMFGGSARSELEAFLAAGSAPVYMGWGSMISVSAEHMTRLAVRTLVRTRRRGIVLGGWAGLSAEKLAGQPDSAALAAYAKEHVLFVQTAPHEWLFPRCAAIVHHGGAGTTAAALRSGVPCVVTPIFLDQFAHRGLVAHSGAGVGTKQFSKVTVPELARAVRRCISDQGMIQRARDLGEELRAEDGVSSAVRAIDSFLFKEVDGGIWQGNFEAQADMLRRMKERGPPGLLAWMNRLCCSASPNEYTLAESKPGASGPTPSSRT